MNSPELTLTPALELETFGLDKMTVEGLEAHFETFDELHSLHRKVVFDGHKPYRLAAFFLLDAFHNSREADLLTNSFSKRLLLSTNSDYRRLVGYPKLDFVLSRTTHVKLEVPFNATVQASLRKYVEHYCQAYRLAFDSDTALSDNSRVGFFTLAEADEIRSAIAGFFASISKS